MKRKDGTVENNMMITPNQCDIFGRIRCGPLANLLELSVAKHMEQFGVGVEAMRNKGKLWFLVKRSMQISRLPLCDEKVRTITWAGKERNGLYPVRVRILAKSGSPLLEASCLWALVDSKERTIASMTEAVAEVPVVTLEGEIKLPEWQVKFPKLTEREERLVTGEQIDHNGHLNNACYLSWAEEIISSEFKSKHELCSLWIEYSKEILADQNVILNYSKEGESFYLKGFFHEEAVFSLKMVYRMQ